MAALLALSSAIAFGFADFLGGRVATRAPALTVTVTTQMAGLAFVLLLAPFAGGDLSAAALGIGALAGVAGGTGLVAYFRALAIGPMGVVAPLTGLVGAMIPVLVGVARGEQVGPLAVAGIVVGLVAVVLSTLDPAGDHEVGAPTGITPPASVLARARNHVASGGAAGPLFGLLAGLLFGAFFVLLDLSPDGSGLWPLVGAKMASVPVLGVLALARRRAWPQRRDLGQVTLSGVLDAVANALFLFATRTGLLALAGLLSSLYPVVIILLARQVLGERLRRVQVAGVGLAVLAVVLVSVG